jgi:antitoxin (DNA-binding transcriptional repressor) of toxin-antitoxin stability system
MSTVSTRGEQIVVLRDGQPAAALVPLPQVRDMDEQSLLAEMGSRGLVTLPKGPALSNRGRLASERVLDDRR